MSKPYNIGVFPCGSEVGLEIHRSLKYARHFQLFGLNSTDDYSHVVYENYIGTLPFVTHPTFLIQLKEVVAKYELDFLFPAMDEVAFYLKKNEIEIGCTVVYNSINVAEIIRRKSTTYQALSGVIPLPKQYTNLDDAKANLPLFSKYDIGYGSRGVQLLKKEDELIEYWEELGDRLFLEYLPYEEYTIDCFSDTKHAVLFAGVRERVRIRMGISVSSRILQIPALAEIAKKISTTLEMQGLWFFQVKKDSDGVYKLLEVASRVSGSMSLYRVLGINFVILDLFQRLGHTVTIDVPTYKNARLERCFNVHVQIDLNYDTVYVDLDDCLIIGDSVNSKLVQFLYQRINLRNKIILITRHEKEVNSTLKKFRLDALFDDIIHIKDRSISKASFMKFNNAIFIDDSFKERNEVAKCKAIPVFAPDAIDAIINPSYV